MKLWLVRHGEAEANMSNDPARKLTGKGQADIMALGKLLAMEGLAIDRAIVSPYTRARQTWEALQAKNHWPLQPIIEQALTPAEVTESILQVLQGCDSSESVLVVSHQPLVSSLTALLVSGSAGNAWEYPMMPGSLAEIELTDCLPGGGKLKRLLSPPYAA